MSKYTLAVCQVYDRGLHGYDSEPNGHHLSLYTCQKEEHPLEFLEFWQPGSLSQSMELDEFVQMAKASMSKRINHCDNPVLCSKEIQRFPKVDIIQQLVLPGGHCVAIKKTHWLSVFQRKWRSHLKEKQHHNAHVASIPIKRKRSQK